MAGRKLGGGAYRPKINDRFWAYNALDGRVHIILDKPFTATSSLASKVVAKDDEGDEWEFLTNTWAFLPAP